MKISDLKILEDVRCRDKYDKAYLELLMEAYKSKHTPPPVVVFYSNSQYILADGFYRVKAAQQLGYLKIEVDIKEGNFNDAVEYSCLMNNERKHNNVLNRGHACKRKSIRNWMKYVDTKISTVDLVRILGISYPTASRERSLFQITESSKKVRRKHKQKPQPAKRRKRKNSITIQIRSAMTAIHAEIKRKHRTQWSPKIKEDILEAIDILYHAVKEENFNFLEI